MLSTFPGKGVIKSADQYIQLCVNCSFDLIVLQQKYDIKIFLYSESYTRLIVDNDG